MLSNACLGFFGEDAILAHAKAWDLVKMSQAFQDPSICFNFLYFQRKVNTFKTPEMCLYLDSDVLQLFVRDLFIILSRRSFTTLRSTSIECGKGKHVSNSCNVPLFRLRHLRRMSHNYFCWIFSLI